MALKREMRLRLRSDPNEFEQTVFQFELVKGEPVAASFEWEDDGEEFRYDGSMYDVIEKKATGNILQVRCIEDKKEAGIMKKMEELKKNRRGNNKSGAIPVQQLLSLLLFNQHNCNELSASFSSLLHIDHYNASFDPIIIDVIAPPPRRISLFNC